jgi:hypothetical protein
LLLSNAKALFNSNNYNFKLKPKFKSKREENNAATKGSKENTFKESLFIENSFNNKITTKNTLFKLASYSAALVYSSCSYSSLLALKGYSYSYSYSYS